MDSEFPSNSRRARATPPANKPEEKKIEAVVTGEVVRRKKPLGKRLIETFIGGSARNVAQYVMMDVLLPSARDTLADMVSQGVERLIFGEARSSSRRTGYRPGGSTGYTQYNRMSGGSGPLSARRDEPERAGTHRVKSSDLDEIILATRVEAEEVIDRLFDLVSRYGQATVSDLNDLVGQSSNYTDEKWGWTDVRGAGVTRIRNGYLLDLPRPEPLR